MSEPLAIDAAEVACLLGYLSHRNGGSSPNRALVYTLTRSGKIPGPIDDTLPPAQWRWSRRRIEAYIEQGSAA